MSSSKELRRSKVIIAMRQLHDNLPLKSFELKPLEANFRKWCSKNQAHHGPSITNKPENIIITKLIDFALDNKFRLTLLLTAEELKCRRFYTEEPATLSKYCGPHIKSVHLNTKCFKGFYMSRKNSLKLEAEFNQAIKSLEDENLAIECLQTNC